MANYWIFKVKDDTNGKYTRTGLEIYKHRMREKVWGIREHTESGKKTANVVHLEKGDKVLFYLCGRDGHCFLGTGVLETGFRPLIEIVIHEEYLDWKQGVSLKSVNPWDNSLPIESLRGKVHFVPEGENYGSYIQGSITRISEKDYNTVISEHTRQN
jgi:hypothetical protein